MYLTSENDTLYGFGWYGVKQWQIEEGGDLTLLNTNDDFCNNCFVGHLIGRSGVPYGDYLYVAARSYLGGGNEVKSADYLKGQLLVMRKKDLSIVQQLDMDIKMVTAKRYGKMLVVSGLKGFDIYDLSEQGTLEHLLYRYRQEDYTEFQGLDFFEADSSVYVAFARFGEGISIHNITNPECTYLVKHISLQDTLSNGDVLPKGGHCFSVEARYPYLFATIGPVSSTFGKDKDRRGILTIDISDPKTPMICSALIPRELYYSKLIGDPSPSYLALCGDSLYTNFGEKGVALFDISTPSEPKFKGLIGGENDGHVISPIHLSEQGILFMGSYHWGTIHSMNIAN